MFTTHWHFAASSHRQTAEGFFTVVRPADPETAIPRKVGTENRPPRSRSQPGHAPSKIEHCLRLRAAQIARVLAAQVV
jgi:hypothetical protein